MFCAGVVLVALITAVFTTTYKGDERPLGNLVSLALNASSEAQKHLTWGVREALRDQNTGTLSFTRYIRSIKSGESPRIHLENTMRVLSDVLQEQVKSASGPSSDILEASLELIDNSFPAELLGTFWGESQPSLDDHGRKALLEAILQLDSLESQIRYYNLALRAYGYPFIRRGTLTIVDKRFDHCGSLAEAMLIGDKESAREHFLTCAGERFNTERLLTLNSIFMDHGYRTDPKEIVPDNSWLLTKLGLDGALLNGARYIVHLHRERDTVPWRRVLRWLQGGEVRPEDCIEKLPLATVSTLMFDVRLYRMRGKMVDFPARLWERHSGATQLLRIMEEAANPLKLLADLDQNIHQLFPTHGRAPARIQDDREGMATGLVQLHCYLPIQREPASEQLCQEFNSLRVPPMVPVHRFMTWNTFRLQSLPLSHQPLVLIKGLSLSGMPRGASSGALYIPRLREMEGRSTFTSPALPLVTPFEQVIGPAKDQLGPYEPLLVRGKRQLTVASILSPYNIYLASPDEVCTGGEAECQERARQLLLVTLRKMLVAAERTEGLFLQLESCSLERVIYLYLAIIRLAQASSGQVPGPQIDAILQEINLQPVFTVGQQEGGESQQLDMNTSLSTEEMAQEREDEERHEKEQQYSAGTVVRTKHPSTPPVSSFLSDEKPLVPHHGPSSHFGESPVTDSFAIPPRVSSSSSPSLSSAAAAATTKGGRVAEESSPHIERQPLKVAYGESQERKDNVLSGDGEFTSMKSQSLDDLDLRDRPSSPGTKSPPRTEGSLSSIKLPPGSGTHSLTMSTVRKENEAFSGRIPTKVIPINPQETLNNPDVTPGTSSRVEGFFIPPSREGPPPQDQVHQSSAPERDQQPRWEQVSRPPHQKDSLRRNPLQQRDPAQQRDLPQQKGPPQQRESPQPQMPPQQRIFATGRVAPPPQQSQSMEGWPPELVEKLPESSKQVRRPPLEQIVYQQMPVGRRAPPPSEPTPVQTKNRSGGIFSNLWGRTVDFFTRPRGASSLMERVYSILPRGWRFSREKASPSKWANPSEALDSLAFIVADNDPSLGDAIQEYFTSDPQDNFDLLLSAVEQKQEEEEQRRPAEQHPEMRMNTREGEQEMKVREREERERLKQAEIREREYLAREMGRRKKRELYTGRRSASYPQRYDAPPFMLHPVEQDEGVYERTPSPMTGEAGSFQRRHSSHRHQHVDSAPSAFPRPGRGEQDQPLNGPPMPRESRESGPGMGRETKKRVDRSEHASNIPPPIWGTLPEQHYQEVSPPGKHDVRGTKRKPPIKEELPPRRQAPIRPSSPGSQVHEHSEDQLLLEMVRIALIEHKYSPSIMNGAERAILTILYREREPQVVAHLAGIIRSVGLYDLYHLLAKLLSATFFNADRVQSTMAKYDLRTINDLEARLASQTPRTEGEALGLLLQLLYPDLHVSKGRRLCFDDKSAVQTLTELLLESHHLDPVQEEFLKLRGLSLPEALQILSTLLQAPGQAFGSTAHGAFAGFLGCLKNLHLLDFLPEFAGLPGLPNLPCASVADCLAAVKNHLPSLFVGEAIKNGLIDEEEAPHLISAAQSLGVEGTRSLFGSLRDALSKGTSSVAGLGSWLKLRLFNRQAGGTSKDGSGDHGRPVASTSPPYWGEGEAGKQAAIEHVARLYPQLATSLRKVLGKMPPEQVFHLINTGLTGVILDEEQEQQQQRSPRSKMEGERDARNVNSARVFIQAISEEDPSVGKAMAQTGNLLVAEATSILGVPITEETPEALIHIASKAGAKLTPQVAKEQGSSLWATLRKLLSPGVKKLTDVGASMVGLVMRLSKWSRPELHWPGQTPKQALEVLLQEEVAPDSDGESHSGRRSYLMDMYRALLGLVSSDALDDALNSSQGIEGDVLPSQIAEAAAWRQLEADLEAGRYENVRELLRSLSGLHLGLPTLPLGWVPSIDQLKRLLPSLRLPGGGHLRLNLELPDLSLRLLLGSNELFELLKKTGQEGLISPLLNYLTPEERIALSQRLFSSGIQLSLPEALAIIRSKLWSKWPHADRQELSRDVRKHILTVITEELETLPDDALFAHPHYGPMAMQYVLKYVQ